METYTNVLEWIFPPTHSKIQYKSLGGKTDRKNLTIIFKGKNLIEIMSLNETNNQNIRDTKQYIEGMNFPPNMIKKFNTNHWREKQIQKI